MLPTAFASAMCTMVIAIDPLSWTQSKSIAWPGQDHYVTVTGNSEPSPPPGCDIEVRTSEVSNRLPYSFRMGEACKKLVVEMNVDGGLNGGEMAKVFLANHESFHLAAQMYGSKIPIDFLEIDPDSVTEFSRGEQFSVFHAEVERLTDGVVNNSIKDCKRLEDSLMQLSDGARRYLEYKIFWEWPAEYYAYTVIFREDFHSYTKFRSNLFVIDDPGYEIFISGVRAGLALDLLVGRNEWQNGVANGQSMLDLLLSSSGCESSPSRPTVRMKRVDLT